ncbi:chromatin silencing protein Clr2 [Schizosaccharomyces cryophilus OY26]|uniref:Chromatin silencing protein Clr2 n=1 Tax=Schizosaccharomyces cryophilus (strain OY26 / ATCC MYA-4695 / CBS 11777 / NBRC 106824 / NRRL Y48691) TaxID=653667 RepID=S9X643_SCHCR|nr:chromatin silencing protein Clr2 [Schizosaccharomyces cryophilus OY26]EPY52577.1 chromatin silencing protein Clr2 [Schizosaccharomyces cryophilus OY26]
MPSITCTWSDGDARTLPSGSFKTRYAPSITPLAHDDPRHLAFRKTCGKLLAQHIFGGSGSTQQVFHDLYRHSIHASKVSSNSLPNTSFTVINPTSAPSQLNTKSLVSSHRSRPPSRTVSTDEPKENAPPKYTSRIITAERFDNYVLEALPKHYQLYQRDLNRDSSGAKREYWVYGHPGGRPFRSMNDFQHHLYWLISDLSRNGANCCCSLCTNGPAKGRRNIQKDMERMFHECKDDTFTWPSSFRLGEVVWIDTNYEIIPGIIVARNLINYETNKDNSVSPFLDAYIEPYQYHCKELGNSRFFFDMAAADIEPWTQQLVDMSRPSHILANDIAHSWCLYGKFRPMESTDVERRVYIDEHHPFPMTVLPIIESESENVDDHFFGVYYGAEKLWINDLCILHTDSLPPEFSKASLMYISDIFVNVDDVVCVQGSLWSQKDATPQTFHRFRDRKNLPRRLQMAEQFSQTEYTLMHSDSSEFICELADIAGRWYEPWSIKGKYHFSKEQKRRVLSRLEAVGNENWVDDDFYELLLSEIDLVSPVVM